VQIRLDGDIQVVAGHFHCALAGANGPIAFGLMTPGQLTEMHPSEGEGYWLNLNSPDPRAFVMWRMREGDGEPPAFPVVVTLSYNQAARMMDGGEQVDSVPLDPRIRAMLEPYTAEHYKPEVRKKHKRNDPFKEGAFVRDRDRGGEPTE
jgi:hypothetical protein